MTGTRVKLVKCPSGKPTSSNSHIGHGMEYTVSNRYTTDGKSWILTDAYGNSIGWAYEWEMEGYKLGIKELEQQLSEAQTKLDTIQSKINWINETGSDEYSEDEFKVYQTLKLLENGKLSMLEKSKLIAELIKK
jgi:hypothetical protein